jgi:hypothetical protein
MTDHWFDHVEKLTRLIVKTEFPRLTRILNSEEDAPPSPGPKTRAEIDVLVFNAFGLPVTADEREAATALDKIFKTLYVSERSLKIVSILICPNSERHQMLSPAWMARLYGQL